MIRSNKALTENYGLQMKEDDPIMLLPPECIGEIFSNLNCIEFQSSITVSRLWSKKIIHAAKMKEFKFLNDFTKLTYEYLEKNLNKTENHSTLFTSPELLNSLNLKQVKASIYGLSENILNTLKDLKDEDLQKLEKLSKEKKDYEPAVRLFKATALYKRIDGVAQLNDEHISKSWLIRNISKDLLSMDIVDKAIEVTAQIIETMTKVFILEEISQYLVQIGNLPKAIVVVNMHEVIWMSSSFIKICKLLLENGRVKEAINETLQFVKTWPKKEYIIFSDFINLLIENKFINEAIEFFNILDKTLKSQLLENLLKLLITSDNSSTMVEVVKTLHSDYPDSCDLSKIALLLINSGHDAKGFEIVNLVTDDYQKAFTLKLISASLINEADIDKSIEVANMIDEAFPLMKINVLRNIWTFLENNGNDAKATEVENMIYGLQYLSWCSIQ